MDTESNENLTKKPPSTKHVYNPEPCNLSDVIVTDDQDNEYYVHSQILGMHSSVLRSAFDPQDQKPYKLQMHQPIIVLTLFFQLMYSKEHTLFLRDYAFEIWKLCVEYDVTYKDICIPQVEYMLQDCEQQMLINIINFSYQVQIKSVRQLALQQLFRRTVITQTVLKQMDVGILVDYLMQIQMYPGKEVVVNYDGYEKLGTIVSIDDFKALVKIGDHTIFHARNAKNPEPIQEHMCVYIPKEDCFGYVQRLKLNGKYLVKIGNIRHEFYQHELTPLLPYLYHP